MLIILPISYALYFIMFGLLKINKGLGMDNNCADNIAAESRPTDCIDAENSIWGGNSQMDNSDTLFLSHHQNFQFLVLPNLFFVPY